MCVCTLLYIVFFCIVLVVMLYVMSMCVCIGSYVVCMFVLQYRRMAVAEYCNYKSINQSINQSIETVNSAIREIFTNEDSPTPCDKVTVKTVAIAMWNIRLPNVYL